MTIFNVAVVSVLVGCAVGFKFGLIWSRFMQRHVGDPATPVASYPPNLTVIELPRKTGTDHAG